MSKNKINFLSLIVWIVSFELVSYYMGLISRGNRGWYGLLEKSILTPPGYVFSIVWPLLYISLAVTGYFLYQKISISKIKQIFFLFILQMIFNWSWSLVFFGLQEAKIAFGILLIIFILTSYILIKSFDFYRIIFYLLLPYFFWMIFAGYLNLIICILN